METLNNTQEHEMQLKACPRCGCDGTDLSCDYETIFEDPANNYEDTKLWKVGCAGCGLEGPAADSEQGAFDAWDKMPRAANTTWLNKYYSCANLVEYPGLLIENAALPQFHSASEAERFYAVAAAALATWKNFGFPAPVILRAEHFGQPGSEEGGQHEN